MFSRKNRKNRKNRQQSKSSIGRKQPHLRVESLEKRELMAADLFSSSFGAQPLLPSPTNDAPTAMISTRVIGTRIQGPVVISGEFDPIGPIGPVGPSTPTFDGSAELSGGILTIHGSNSRDKILIQEMTKSNGLPSILVTVENTQGDEVLRKSFLKPFVNSIKAFGENGSDLITNNSYVESILYGGAGSDTLIGGWVNDILYGGQGNDRLIGRGGNDFQYGQNGNDTYVFAGSGYLGKDSIFTIEDTSVRGYTEGRDTIDFSGLRQTVSRFALNQVIAGPGVTFSLDLDDAQRVNGQLSLTLDLGRGRQTRVTNLIGTNYADTLHGDGEDNRLDGRGGNDRLFGYDGDDVLVGGSGQDRLYGDAGRDTLDGGGGNDFLSGRQGDDIYAFAGRASLGTDEIDEAGGSDTYDFSRLGRSVNLDLGSTGDATGMIRPNTLVTINANTRLPNVENILGTKYVDFLIGNEQDNRLQSNGSNDVIFGKGGNDGLFGGSGNDWLDGGAGNDALWTGTGDDRAFGRAGVDRFHVHEDYDKGEVTDETSSDLRFDYSNGDVRTNEYGTWLPGEWQDRDVELIDQAFAKLQETGNTAMLEPKWAGDYHFVRQGNRDGSGFDVNAIFYGYANTVIINQLAFSSIDLPQRVVIHELAHAWDRPGGNPFHFDFLELSGWTYHSPAANELDRYEKGGSESKNWWYLKDAGFVSDHAKSNPQEDFAETVEAYFADKFGFRHEDLKIDATTASKLQLIEDWIDSLSTSTSTVIVNPRRLTYRPTGRVFGGWGR